MLSLDYLRKTVYLMSERHVKIPSENLSIIVRYSSIKVHIRLGKEREKFAKSIPFTIHDDLAFRKTTWLYLMVFNANTVAVG